MPYLKGHLMMSCLSHPHRAVHGTSKSTRRELLSRSCRHHVVHLIDSQSRLATVFFNSSWWTIATAMDIVGHACQPDHRHSPERLGMESTNMGKVTTVTEASCARWCNVYMCCHSAGHIGHVSVHSAKSFQNTKHSHRVCAARCLNVCRLTSQSKCQLKARGF